MPHVTPLPASDPRRIGRYQLAGRIIGMPASGPVYLARSANGSQVTVSLLGSEWVTDGAARDRFAAEAAAAKRVAPFCAARILDAGLDGGQAFLVSEYVAGPSLLEVITSTGVRSGADLEMLAIGAATGLAAIHQAGLVHGEFGPGHLIVGAQGPRVVGYSITPPYGAATPSADMLAWAQTVGFAATGRPPASPGDLAALPPALRRVVTDCLSAGPAGRPAARVVLRDLLGQGDPPAGLLAEGSRRAAGAASAGLSASRPPPPEPPEEPGRARRRRTGRIWWTAAAIAAVLVAVVGVREIQDAGRTAGHTRPGTTSGRPSGPASDHLSPATSPPASASAAPTSAAAAIPQALAGSWSGRVRQGGPADVFGVEISLASGASSGSISYAGAGFTCTGRLSVLSAAGSAVTMNQQIVTGKKACENGVVTVRPGSASGTVLFVFRGAAGPQATGTLRARH
jgi:hypothetical protein